MLSHSDGGMIAVLPITILALFFIVFWVKMLFDALRREFKDSGTKVAWVLVILFGHGLGAIIYYFVVYAKDRPGRSALAGHEQDCG